ncbi:hypothetical protein [Dokdonella sp.]|uniref:hypothetical protein n=1 Tax=Dokdonella sp. TaxID=2291710 RepID=UPI0025C24619|nr:hypothetical protein [Dokdonella sp.]
MSAVVAAALTALLYGGLLDHVQCSRCLGSTIWLWFGAMWALAAGITMAWLTKGDCWWLPTAPKIEVVVLFVYGFIGCVLIVGSLFLLGEFLLAFALAGVPLHGSGRGVPADLGGWMLVFFMAAYLGMQFLAIRWARSIAAAAAQGRNTCSREAP